MKRGFKKFGAFLLTAVMALTMNLTVFAAPTALDGGIEGDTDDTASIQENTITIMKELKVYNTTGGNIYLPTVGYTYTISAVTVADGITVTDSHDHVGKVYTGVMDALDGSSKTVDFSPATASGYGNDGTATAVTINQPTTAATTGTAYYGGFEITVDPSEYTHSGIYRYKIVEAENTTNTLAKAGVVHQNDTNYSDTRYLDVYVRLAVEADVTAGKATAVGDRVVYGYVMWNPDSQDQDTSITKTPNVTKTNGWVDTTGGDKYNTFNLVVTKDIRGSLAEVNHQFPFQVVLTSPNATAAQIYYKATHGIPATETTASISSASTTTIGTLTNASTLKLTDDDSVTFYGLPAGVTATVQENNDTFDIYTVNATITANTAQTYTEVQVQAGANATIISGLDNATTTTAIGTADTKTDWINELAVVSPTGFVVRFAPYALVLMGGLFLIVLGVVLYKRTNKEEA